jgi:uncharacterized protein YdaU (DUF1376 family)
VNYYEHHLGDYLRDTAHLTMIEDGAYRRLLDAYYIKRGPLPLALKDVYRLARAITAADRKAVETVLREFFKETQAGWSHGRCDAEIAKYQGKRDKARDSANARWSVVRPHDKTDADALPTHNGHDADALPTQCEGNALHSPVTNHQSHRDGKPPRRPAKRAPEDFAPDLDFAREQIADLDAEAEAAKFRDFEFKTPRSDWPAAWRNWIRTCRDNGKYARRAQAGKINPRDWL